MAAPSPKCKCALIKYMRLRSLKEAVVTFIVISSEYNVSVASSTCICEEGLAGRKKVNLAAQERFILIILSQILRTCVGARGSVVD
jgi:hypothetical protein